jgi:alkylated DNA nucleotide flippase Atl1
MENHSQEEHAKWHQLVEEQQASELSQKEFCKQRELVLSQLVYYRCQLKNLAERYQLL